MESANVKKPKDKTAMVKNKPLAGGSILRKCACRDRASTGSRRENDDVPNNSFLQRKCACGNHTMAGGECAACRHERNSRFVPQDDSALNNHDGQIKAGLQRVTIATAVTRMASPASRDFSRIPARARTGQSILKSTIVDPVRRKADTNSKAVDESQSHEDTHPIVDFGTWHIRPIYGRPANHRSVVDVPAGGASPEDQFTDLPPGQAAKIARNIRLGIQRQDECEQPTSMGKITSGAFLGGLTMDSYYPDLVGRGFYEHPGSGGAFDTGSRVGANVQLYGVIPGPCDPGHFHLEQTVSRTRYRINGTTHAREGEVADDIAKSGRDASTAPFRQEFLGGGTAPLGYIISMADPPSTSYSANMDKEHDREFVTSLVGPGGRRSVEWALSTRIENGVVTTNDLT